jgi:hypothetical protein
LVELRDGTGYAGWTGKKEGWNMLEEHKDPGRCGGLTVDADGKITSIELQGLNLTGKKRTFRTLPVVSRV